MQWWEPVNYFSKWFFGSCWTMKVMNKTIMTGDTDEATWTTAHELYWLWLVHLQCSCSFWYNATWMPSQRAWTRRNNQSFASHKKGVGHGTRIHFQSSGHWWNPTSKPEWMWGIRPVIRGGWTGTRYRGNDGQPNLNCNIMVSGYTAHSLVFTDLESGGMRSAAFIWFGNGFVCGVLGCPHRNGRNGFTGFWFLPNRWTRWVRWCGCQILHIQIYPILDAFLLPTTSATNSFMSFWTMIIRNRWNHTMQTH